MVDPSVLVAQLELGICFRMSRLPDLELPKGFAFERDGEDRLGLRYLPEPKWSPLLVDYLAPAFQRRLRAATSKSELLLRAIGKVVPGDSEKSPMAASGGSPPLVLDATAGLGYESALIAQGGFHVCAVERSPVLCALVEDALERARKNEQAWALRLRIFCGDCLDVVAEQGLIPEIVYLDPMFPDLKSSALPKLKMQILRELHSQMESTPEAELLAWARSLATKRVVFKRPSAAPSLAKPTR